MSRTINISGTGFQGKELPQLNPVLPPLSAVTASTAETLASQVSLRLPESASNSSVDFSALLPPALVRLFPEDKQTAFLGALRNGETFTGSTNGFQVASRVLPSGSLSLEFRPLERRPESDLGFECRVDSTGRSTYIRLSGDRQVAERITAAEFFSILRG